MPVLVNNKGKRKEINAFVYFGKKICRISLLETEDKCPLSKKGLAINMGNNASKKNLTPEQLEELRIQREKKRAKKELEKQTAAKKEAIRKRNKIIISVSIATVLVLGIILSIVGCSISEARKKDSCEYFRTRDTSERDVHYAKICVSGYGDIILLLDATSAPITVTNFIKLVEADFYDGLTFHRIMSDFMIQGGDPNADGTGSSSEKIKGEFSSNGWSNDILHKNGVISMARGNSKDSASCQFFICNASNENVSKSLDGSYAAFGYVIAGLPIVHKITENTEQYASSFNSNTITDKSKQAVIESIEIISEEAALSYTK